MTTKLFAFALFSSTQFDKSYAKNMFLLKSLENFANEILNVRGHIFLNEVFDMVGFPRTRIGALTGWVKGEETKTISFGLQDDINKENKNVVNQTIYLQFNTDPGEILDKIDKKKDDQMAYRLDEKETVSPTRTYIVVVEDLVCPNDARYVKVILPKGFENNSRSARYYYLSIEPDRGARLVGSIAWENYISDISNIVDEIITEKPEVEVSTSLYMNIETTKEIEEIFQMLDNWSGEYLTEKNLSYPEILRRILVEWDKNNKKLIRIGTICE